MKVKRSLCIASDLSELERLHDAVAELGEAGDWPPDLVYQVDLVLEELIVNTVNYGYDDDARHEIEVTLTSDEDVFTVEIIDDGHAFNPLSDAPEPDLDAGIEDRPIGGLGIHLMRVMMDDVHYRREENKNHLTLVKRRNG
ncbi:MAG: ATP-binding protein [Gemmatimonadetes bacterium]|nr:ATP-binding protein [Gemmatimonadota bacterium]MYF18680.1 ATP-binding protein [Gemmatimonadota bacterium]